MTNYQYSEKIVKMSIKFEPENKILLAIQKLGGVAHTQQIAEKLSIHQNDIISSLDRLDTLSCIYQKYGYTNHGATSFWFLTEKGQRRAANYSNVIKGALCRK